MNVLDVDQIVKSSDVKLLRETILTLDDQLADKTNSLINRLQQIKALKSTLEEYTDLTIRTRDRFVESLELEDDVEKDGKDLLDLQTLYFESAAESLSSLETELKQKKALLETAQDDRKLQIESRESVEEKITDLQTLITTLSNKLSESEGQVELLNEGLCAKDEIISTLREEVNNYTAAHNQFVEESASLKNELEARKDEIKAWLEVDESRKQLIKLKEEEMSAKQKTLDHANQTYEAARQELLTADEQISSLNAQISTLKDEVGVREDELDLMSQKLRLAEENWKYRAQILGQLNKKVTAFKTSVHERSEKVEEFSIGIQPATTKIPPIPPTPVSQSSTKANGPTIPSPDQSSEQISSPLNFELLAYFSERTQADERLINEMTDLYSAETARKTRLALEEEIGERDFRFRSVAESSYRGRDRSTSKGGILMSGVGGGIGGLNLSGAFGGSGVGGSGSGGGGGSAIVGGGLGAALHLSNTPISPKASLGRRPSMLMAAQSVSNFSYNSPLLGGGKSFARRGSALHRQSSTQSFSSILESSKSGSRRVLRLGGPRFTERDLRPSMAAISASASVTSIIVEKSSLNDNLAAAISTALIQDRHISRISFSGCQLSGRSGSSLCTVLTDNAYLSSIDLSHNQLGDTGLKHISEGLQTNNTLTSLELSSNGITSEGAKHLANALKINSGLKTLNLSENPIGDEGLKFILDAVHDDTGLLSLSLWSNNLSHLSMEALGKAFPHLTLQHLAFCSTSLADAPPSCIKSFATGLAQNHSLQRLDLTSCSISGSSISPITEALSKPSCEVQELILWANPLGIEGAKAIAQLLGSRTKLSSLSLKGTSIGEVGIKLISEKIATNGTLKSLDVSGNDFGSEGARFLSDALTKNNTLTSVFLGGNEIGDEGADCILKSVSRQRSPISTLNIEFNSLTDDACKGDRLAQLAGNADFSELNLAWNFLERDSLRSLKSLLCKTSTLYKLYLDGNSIDVERAKLLGEGLSKNETLKLLSLTSASLRPASIKPISDAMKTQKSITKLYLKGNALGDQGIASIAEALKLNSHLVLLDISHCSFSNDGIFALCDGLKLSKSLWEIDVVGNNFDGVGGNALMDAAIENQRLDIRL